MDMEALKHDYCAGEISIEKVAIKHGMKKSTLIDLAKKKGWIRKKKPTNKADQKYPTKQNGRTEKLIARRPGINKTVTQKHFRPDPKRSCFGSDLSEQEKLYVSYFLETRDKFGSYQKAGYTGSDRNARMLHRKPVVARAIARGVEAMCEQIEIRAVDILRHWQDIATADPNAISQLRRTCCRYCWGDDHHYQWIDEAEYDEADARSARDSKPPPDVVGGFGFTHSDDPNPDCPKCTGEGVENVFFSDSRDLFGPERRLYAGVKQTKFGIEVMLRDQDAALKNLAAFYNIAASEQDREKNTLELERLRLANEKLRVEIENIRKGGKEGELVVVHNALQVPGAVQSTQATDEGD